MMASRTPAFRARRARACGAYRRRTGPLWTAAAGADAAAHGLTGSAARRCGRGARAWAALGRRSGRRLGSLLVSALAFLLALGAAPVPALCALAELHEVAVPAGGGPAHAHGHGVRQVAARPAAQAAAAGLEGHCHEPRVAAPGRAGPPTLLGTDDAAPPVHACCCAGSGAPASLVSALPEVSPRVLGALAPPVLPPRLAPPVVAAVLARLWLRPVLQASSYARTHASLRI